MAASVETDVTGSFTITDIIQSYTSLDDKAKYMWAANVLSRKCPFFMDMPMKPSNQIMSNIGARVSQLNTPLTRGFNQGVAPTAVHTVQYTEGIAMIEDYSEVDKVLCDIQNNPGSWRQERDRIKLEAMTQTAENLILYGSKATDPNAWNGLTTRFNLSTLHPNGDAGWPVHVALAGGSTASTVASIWIIAWGEGKIFGIYPPNLPAGIKVQDLGEVTVVTNSLAVPNYMQAYRTFMGLYFGLNVEDERYVQRIANHEVTGDVNTFDPRLLLTMLNRLPERDGAVIYMDRTLKTQCDIYALDKSNGFYTQEGNGDIFGRPVTVFQGVPVRQSGMLLDTETVIT
ncbi:MAG: hypothetical protein EHM49_01085 [Deltaproteobacteria bacterium]|nr:MAG: hypothetical protein EHM49_01085 [Deltaproteobacteria bacterium]